MTITQLHLANFLQLVEEAGSLTKLARKCGYDNAASLSQLKRRLEEQAEDEKARGSRPSPGAGAGDAPGCDDGEGGGDEHVDCRVGDRRKAGHGPILQCNRAL